MPPRLEAALNLLGAIAVFWASVTYANYMVENIRAGLWGGAGVDGVIWLGALLVAIGLARRALGKWRWSFQYCKPIISRLRYPEEGKPMISMNWRSNDPRLVLLILGSVFSLVGSILLGIQVWQSSRTGRMQQTWQQTQAVITESQVRKVWDEDGVMYQPDVSYHYQVDGRTYQGVALEPFSNNYRTSNFASVQRSLLPYQKGTRVPVYFDPGEPGNSALSLRNGNPPVLLWIGLPFFLMGLGFLVAGLRWKGTQPALTTE